MIAEIIFSDYYRTFLLCVLSLGIAFYVRNGSMKAKIIAFTGYELIILCIFSWILIVSAVITEFYYESIRSIAKWELKWILYFTISIILQLIVYYFFWKKNKGLKAVTLLLNVLIVIVPLSICNFN